MRFGITLTINYASGLEMEDRELAAPSLEQVGPIVDEYIKQLADPDYSSLMIVVVPDAAPARVKVKPALRLVGA